MNEIKSPETNNGALEREKTSSFVSFDFIENETTFDLDNQQLYYENKKFIKYPKNKNEENGKIRICFCFKRKHKELSKQNKCLEIPHNEKKNEEIKNEENSSKIEKNQGCYLI